MQTTGGQEKQKKKKTGFRQVQLLELWIQLILTAKKKRENRGEKKTQQKRDVLIGEAVSRVRIKTGEMKIH